MTDWKDSTSYSRGTERVQTAWTLHRDFVRITITSAHIRNPGRWTLHCHALNMDTVDMGLPNDVAVEVAQACAKNMVASKAREIARAVSACEVLK